MILNAVGASPPVMPTVSHESYCASAFTEKNTGLTPAICDATRCLVLLLSHLTVQQAMARENIHAGRIQGHVGARRTVKARLTFDPKGAATWYAGGKLIAVFSLPKMV